MKKVACLALVGALGLFGCGGSSSGDDDDDISFPVDAGTDDQIDGGGNTGECNPVSQTGCQAGEKCAMIIDQLDPYIGHVGCIADGTANVGEACTEGAAVGTSDNCKAGGECYNGFCHEICTTVNDQCADGACQTFVDGSGNPLPTEICLFGCDPLAQDCAGDGEGCFLTSAPVCVRAGTANPGEECQYANSCVPGNICIGNPGKCRPFCGPWQNGWSETADDPPQLNWPNCCSSECTGQGVTTPCTGVNELCWPIFDSNSEIIDEFAGFCISDVDITGDGTSLNCSCTGGNAGAGVDKCEEVM